MRREQNITGGETIWLDPGESLKLLPREHRALVNAELEAAFATPQQHFLALADASPLVGFQRYLRDLASDCRCALVTATADEMFGGAKAAIAWWTPYFPADRPHLVLIEPGLAPGADDPYLGFEQLFSQVSWIHWDDIGCAGGLLRPGEFTTVEHYGASSRSKKFPAAASRVFGNSRCGDMLIYNPQGEAGFLSHENGKAYSLGSVTDALNWIFDELRQGRSPEFDYDRVR